MGAVSRDSPPAGSQAYKSQSLSSPPKFPIYKSQMLLQLTQLYDLLTPPSTSFPTLKQTTLAEPTSYPAYTNNWSLKPHVYLIEVPPSLTKTENNGRTTIEELFFDENRLHAAEATRQITSPETTTFASSTSTTTTTPPLASKLSNGIVDGFFSIANRDFANSNSVSVAQELEEE
ncbi:unnamed protein product, partial [Strongylus vulgaris]